DGLDRSGPRVDRHGGGSRWVVTEQPRLLDPVLERTRRRFLETGVDRELQLRRLLLGWHAEGAGDAAQGVDRDFRLHEACVEQRVVRCLDAALADELARLRALVRAGLQLGLADLAEQAEELAAERALRVA